MRAVAGTQFSVARIAMTIAVGALIVTGCAAQQPIVQRDDVTITGDVRARMASDTLLSKSDISVDTKAGVVRLAGSVSTDGERNAAERVARETPGVRSVDNNVIFGMAPPAAATH